MNIFEYSARDKEGIQIKGTLNALDEKDLANKLAKIGLILINGSEHRSKKTLYFGKIKRREIILFTHHLATSIEAGIPLVQALTDYAEEIDKGLFKNILKDVTRQVMSGNTFSDSLTKYQKTFPQIYTSIIATGEATGDLDIVLKDLVGFMEWQEELIGQIKQASIYPVFLISMIVVVIIIMMTFTIPRFISILEGFNVELPLPTRILLSSSKFFVNSWYVFVIFIGGFIIIYKYSRKSPQGRYFWDNIKLNLPLFGKLHHKIVLSKFSHYFSMLYNSGIGIIESFNIINEIIMNEVIRRSIVKSAEAVEKGDSIYNSLKNEKTFPNLILRMIQVGESTGHLDVTLQKASAYYEKEVPQTIKKLFAVLEPLLILLLGGFVLFIALSIFLPIYKLTSAIGAQS